MKRTLLLCVAFVGVAALAEKLDDVDRIVAAVGVDSMHSVNEEARTRQMLTELLSEASKSPTAKLPSRDGPEFEAVVARLIAENRQMRRDPLVFDAYRKTLTQMLTPSELASAAAFYGTPTGRKVHIAVIEAEKAAAIAMEEVAARQK